MNNEKLIKLNRSEVFRVEVCLSARKTFLETLREEENSELELVNDLIRDNNDDIDKELEEINEIFSKVDNIDNSIYEGLSELSKEELILKIKQLEDKNAELAEENRDLKEDFKNSESINTLKVASFFTSYENIQRRYDLNNVPYQMENPEDIAKVFGLRFDSIQGFYDLSQEDKEIFKNGIVKFLNAFGLGNRVPYLPIKVWKENGEFRFLTLEGGARQQFMKSTGEVY